MNNRIARKVWGNRSRKLNHREDTCKRAARKYFRLKTTRSMFKTISDMVDTVFGDGIKAQ
jgi:hypothetical protein